MNTTNHIGEDAANGAIGERAALLADYIELNMSNYGPDDVDRLNAWAIEAYDFISRAALTAEKVAAEPVAWMTKSDGYVFYGYNKPDRVEEELIPLYTAPQQPAQSAEQDERAAAWFYYEDDEFIRMYDSEEKAVAACEKFGGHWEPVFKHPTRQHDRFDPYRLKVAEECCERLMSACTDAGCPDGVRMDDWIRDTVARAASTQSTATQLAQTQVALTAAPRYREWLHLTQVGMWTAGVPTWARDHDGRMNDGIAMRSVIEELAALLAAQPVSGGKS